MTENENTYVLEVLLRVHFLNHINIMIKMSL